MSDKLIDECQKVIGYKFKDVNLLELSLTHSSYANENKQEHTKGKKPKDNERLEFLGDAVLELATSNNIFHTYPDMHEGKMSKYRASIVCEPTLAACAREFNLEKFLLLGKGEEATGGRERDSIISDALEALIGAIYLDGGMKNATKFIDQFILNDIDDKRLFYDSKSSLQEVIQAMGKEVVYTDIASEGPQHDKVFTVEAETEGLFRIEATGNTKKTAQQNAAHKALVELKKKGMFGTGKGK